MTLPVWTTAIPDWEKRIVERLPLIPFAPLFPAEAEHALSVMRDLRIVDAPGSPTMGEACAPWVFDFAGAIFGSYDPSTGRRHIQDYFLLVSKKNSKALALDTPIPTPRGWTTMGALEVGDYVFGANGKPTRVAATSEVFYGNDCYRMEFSNGESVVADAGHLWKTDALADKPGAGKREKGWIPTGKTRSRVRTTEEIAGTLYRGYDKANNHSFQMPLSLDLPDVELPIPPYTLGAWLGDGTTANGNITSMDLEIVNSIEQDGFTLTPKYKKGRATNYIIGKRDRSFCRRGHKYSETSNGLEKYPRCRVCVNEVRRARYAGAEASPYTEFSFHEILRDNNLLNNKHIPEKYLRASHSQRLALLQGLMDTDGTISKAATAISFTNINQSILQGMSELLATFGVKHSVIERDVTCSGVPAGRATTIQFHCFRDELEVFRLPRKLDRMRVSSGNMMKPRSKTVHVVNATKIESVPTKCIRVEAEDHQFLFGRTMLPTHNSTVAGAIMLTALILNWRESGEYLILAPTVEVAQNAYNPVRDMIKYDEELSEMFQVQDHIRTVTHRITGATLKVVAADSATVSGKKAIGVLIDELWEFGRNPQADNMIKEATGGLASRPEGFVIYLSTQSDKPPQGIFRTKLGYAREVRDGLIEDPGFLPVIYEHPKSVIAKKDHLKVENFYMTNPNIGLSVDEPFLIRGLEKAKREGQESYIGFLAKHANVEIGLALRSDRWAGADFWEQQGDTTLTFESILKICEVICIGIDGGGLDDLLGLHVVGRVKDSQEWVAWSHAWCHKKVLELRQSEAPALLDFQRQGDLTIVDELGEDIAGVTEYVKRVFESDTLYQVGLDPAGIGALLDALTEANIPEDKIVGVSQGWKLGGAIKTTERKLAEKKLRHCAQPLMAWCVGNARVEPRANSILITKQASGTAKIDPLMALFNAVTLLSLNPPSQKAKFQMFVLG